MDGWTVTLLLFIFVVILRLIHSGRESAFGCCQSVPRQGSTVVALRPAFPFAVPESKNLIWANARSMSNPGPTLYECKSMYSLNSTPWLPFGIFFAHALHSMLISTLAERMEGVFCTQLVVKSTVELAIRN